MKTVDCPKHGTQPITKDHIIPRSLGGILIDWNRQDICLVCNQEKANYVPDVVELKNGVKVKMSGKVCPYRLHLTMAVHGIDVGRYLNTSGLFPYKARYENGLIVEAM